MSINASSEHERETKSFISWLLSWKLAVVALVFIVIIVVSIAGYQRAAAIQAEYRAAVEQVQDIQDVANSDDIYALSSGDMTWLNSEFTTLEGRIDEIDRLASLPFGFESTLGSLPWIEPRYTAGMETLEVGRMLAQSGKLVSEIGEEAIAALDDTGVRFDPENDGTTWLDVIQARESDLYDALNQINVAIEIREGIDEEYLPDRVVQRLNQIDEVMDRFDEQLELADDLPLAYAALGADEPVHYLLLFQNPAELRPTGGFVGTIAELELHRGQISFYEFHDVYQLSSDYQNQSEMDIDPPWAIGEYVRSDDLQIQDANWSPDFPTSARLFKEMTEAAGWSEIAGVVAVQPETVQELMTVTGPVEVDVDGDLREITSENLFEESERQRRIAREGGIAETQHKEVIELISEILVDELSTGGRDALIDSTFLLFDQFDQRDMQAYHADPEVQSFLEERNWAGLANPAPELPTLSVIFANITGLKTSLAMQPDMEIQLLESDTEGVVEGILTIGLNHEGAKEADPFYEGFQRWWIDVSLPEGTRIVESVPDLADDPDASNGGAYVIDLEVEEREEIAIRFTMPETVELLLRRQPGLLPMIGILEQNGCADPVEFQLTEDQVISFEANGCPALQEAPQNESG
jgi:hypothetical protein